MKTFISLIAAVIILYMGQDTETEMTTLENRLPLSTTAPKELKYQHTRFVGEDIEIVVNDLWETQVLRLRLPRHIQVADSIVLDKYHLQYQKEFVYRTIEGAMTIQKKGEYNDSNFIEGQLSYCVTDEKDVFCVTKMPIRIVY